MEEAVNGHYAERLLAVLREIEATADRGSGSMARDRDSDTLREIARRIQALEPFMCPFCEGSGEDQNNLNDPGPCHHCGGEGIAQ